MTAYSTGDVILVSAVKIRSRNLAARKRPRCDKSNAGSTFAFSTVASKASFVRQIENVRRARKLLRIIIDNGLAIALSNISNYRDRVAHIYSASTNGYIIQNIQRILNYHNRKRLDTEAVQLYTCHGREWK